MIQLPEDDPSVCELCGGPAVWTLLEGEAYYHCRRSCEGFLQLELFVEQGVSSSMRSDAAAASDDRDQLPF